jgi:hypothetical protein
MLIETDSKLGKISKIYTVPKGSEMSQYVKSTCKLIGKIVSVGEWTMDQTGNSRGQTINSQSPYENFPTSMVTKGTQLKARYQFLRSKF